MAERLTDEWLVHADAHALPHEDLPLRLPAGRTGADYGWPDRMMGAATFQMLADRQITRTSQLIQLAECMTEAQFQAYFEGNLPCWAYLRRAGEVRPGSGNRQDYEDRLRAWQADQYNVNNRILGEWLFRREPPHGPPHPPPVPALPGIPIHPPFERSELLDEAAGERVRTAIAENWRRQGCAGPLPQEDLPLHLRHGGETGAHYGWPDLMMDTDTLQMLADRQITRTSQLIQLAECMTEAQFQAYVGGNRPCWAYLISLVDLTPENCSEYEARKRRWLEDHCVVNARILDGWRRGKCKGLRCKELRLRPGDVVSRGGRDLNQLQLVKDSIAENDRRNEFLVSGHLPKVSWGAAPRSAPNQFHLLASSSNSDIDDDIGAVDIGDFVPEESAAAHDSTRDSDVFGRMATGGGSNTSGAGRMSTGGGSNAGGTSS